MRKDPQERDRTFRDLLKRVEKEAASRTEARGIVGFGSCHAVWAEMKAILTDEHGISWRSPADMNPLVLFD